MPDKPKAVRNRRKTVTPKAKAASVKAKEADGARAITNARIFPMAPAPWWAPAGLAPSGPRPREEPWTRTAQAMLWEGDTILAVGKAADVLPEARRSGASVEDLGGRVVLPGFVDAHMHFLHAGLKPMRPDLRGAKGLGDCMARVTSWLKANPGKEAVTGEGWDESGWSPRRRPERRDLDKACAAAGQKMRPLVLRRIDGHIAVANSAALPLVRKRWDSDALVDMQSGILLEEASLYLNEVLPASAATLDLAVLEACRIAHSHGVTTVGDYSQAPFRQALQRAAARGDLSVRVSSSVYAQQLEAEIGAGFRTGRRGLGPKDGAKVGKGKGGPVPGPDGGDAAVGGTSPFLKDGGLKVFLDGSLGAHTAALRGAYLDGAGGKGTLNWSAAEVQRMFRRAHEAGIQLHAHAIGDGAIDQGLDAFERIRGRPGPDAPDRLTPGGPPGADRLNPLRHRFEHYEIAHDDQLARTAKLGIVSSSQPNFVGEWSSKGGMYETRLGEAFRLNNRFQAMLAAGVRIAFGSDGMPFGPLVGIQAAVTHPETTQRMAPLQAVWHYTWMAAWSLHWENQVGSLEAGKKADFVILEETNLDGLPGTWRIRETVVGGEKARTNP